MKGFLSAVIILTLLLSFLLYYSIYINRSFSDFSEYLDKIIYFLISENYEKAEKLSGDFCRNLKDKSHTLYIVTDRSPIDNAIAECERLISFIRTEDKSEAIAAAGGISIILEKTKEKSLMRLFAKNTGD